MRLKIELLYFDGCPSHAELVQRLAALLAQAGVNEPVHERRVDSDADAQRERFLGSPTVRVDGVDVEPGAGERRDYGLRCRLYRTDNRLSGVPPDRWVLDALLRAGRRAS